MNEKKVIKCSYCGKEKSQDKFKMCEKCREYYRILNKKNSKYIPVPKRKYACVICGKKGETTHAGKKTCGNKCSEELTKQKIRKWHQSPKGKEYIRKKMREYIVSEKGRKKRREYREKNREEINAYQRNYQKTHQKTKE